ncbi:MAG: hypothetical protein U1C74_31970 [Phenylobacterium sp.]|uniref:hypothetical protein n=1 Tax=Brevundimonas sp. TaxID=1871086 RepID=UPI002737E783|nr:hypothetical protein [Brevundimonas sp.]MDP3803474.1 hypothetical protein [Brevundimonas sp.]MDZ4376021.1 hypothetical protein [Phenylobacterium sp.]
MADIPEPWKRLLATTDLPHLVPGLAAAVRQGADLAPHTRDELLREIDAYWLGDEVPDFSSSGDTL